MKAALEGLSRAAPEMVTPSIAVLPFQNMSGEKENEYFSDGIAEEILNLLARMPELKVSVADFGVRIQGEDGIPAVA